MIVSFAMVMPLVALTMTVVAVLMLMLVLVSRHVFVVVPVIAHEVAPPAAGVVLGAMLAPVLFMARRHVQIDRRSRHEFRRRLDHHRSGIYYLRLRNVADIDLAEESGLADGDRHGHIAGHCCAADRGKTECRRRE